MCQVGVTLGGRWLGMSKNLPNDQQTASVGGSDAGEAMSKIMQTNIG